MPRLIRKEKREHSRPWKAEQVSEVPLNATARAALKRTDLFLTKPRPQDTTPLFLSEKRHAQLTERGLGYLIKKYAEQAKLHDISPHDLRHRFGYRMAETVPLHRLAQLMGHDSLDTLCCMYKERKTICSRQLRRLPGHRSGEDGTTEERDRGLLLL